MTIKLHCEHCGATVQAARDLAGRMSNCPSCGNSLYVPTPEDELEELPLAPEDVTDLRKEAILQEERRKLDTLLAREERAGGGDEGGPSGRAQSTGSGSGAAVGRSGDAPAVSGANRMEAALTRYLIGMRDSDFDSVERAITTLNMQPRTAREMIDRLAADPVPPPEMAKVPSGVYQGFLKTLRSRL